MEHNVSIMDRVTNFPSIVQKENDNYIMEVFHHEAFFRQYDA